MKIKYRWFCQNCEQTIITSEARTPDTKGCPTGYDVRFGIENDVVYEHIWHGEEIEEEEKIGWNKNY